MFKPKGVGLLTVHLLVFTIKTLKYLYHDADILGQPLKVEKLEESYHLYVL